MFDDFDPAHFDSPDFKEDSVREVIIAPIFRRLGYKASGVDRIIRSKSLVHPFIYIGTRKHPVTIIPDYILLHEDKPILILDAKHPAEDVLNKTHIHQAYSYAIHPEVRSKHFALCNGRNISVFSIDKAEPLLVLPFEKFETCWSELEKHMAPRYLLQPFLRRFAPDFGFKLLQMGFQKSGDFVMPGVRLGTFGRVADGLYTAGSACDFGGEKHAINFDFSSDLLLDVVAGLPEEPRKQFIEALSCAPFLAAAELTIEVDISVRLGQETQGTYETFVPLIIHKVLESRFNPSPVEDDPKDIPPYVYRLRSAFVIVTNPPENK